MYSLVSSRCPVNISGKINFFFFNSAANIDICICISFAYYLFILTNVLAFSYIPKKTFQLLCKLVILL